MKRNIILKSLLTFVMVLWYLLMPVTGYANGSIHPASAHFLYLWSHANIWHLAGNVFVLCIMRGKLHLLPSLLIATICSFIPAFGLWPVGMTVGFSGVLFAIAGIKWGIYCRRAAFRHLAYADFCFKALPFALLGCIIPHVNWCIHLYCILAGFAFGRFSMR